MFLFGGTGPKENVVLETNRITDLVRRMQQNPALLNMGNEEDIPVNIFEDIERFFELIQMPQDYDDDSSEESGGSDDDNEAEPNPRKLYTKADLYVLELESKILFKHDKI